MGRTFLSPASWVVFIIVVNIYMDEIALCDIEIIKMQIVNELNWSDYEDEEDEVLCCCFSFFHF